MQVRGKGRWWGQKIVLDNIRKDMQETRSMREDMAHNLSARHMKIKTGQLLHGGGL